MNRSEKAFIVDHLSRDPFKTVYLKAAIVYACLLTLALLAPFDFELLSFNAVQWEPENNGVTFPERGLILSDGPAKQLTHQVIQSNGFSMEIWLEAQTIDQSGPARIVSLSTNTAERNFTLAQSFDQLVFRLRTTETDNNGTQPHLIVNHVFIPKKRLHIVVTYDTLQQQVFVNGELRKRSTLVKGNLSNWDDSHWLAIGNEVTGDRSWLGTIFQLAIYNHALDRQMVLQHYETGLGERDKGAHALTDDPGPAALYYFDHAQGRRVVDIAAVPQPLDLTIPRTLQNRTKLFLSFPEDIRWSSRYMDHFIMNTMILIPLGFFATAAWRNSRRRVVPAVLLGMLFCTVFIFSMESLQYLSLTRDSSLFDASANVLGAFLGACLYVLFQYHLNHYRKALLKKLA